MVMIAAFLVALAATPASMWLARRVDLFDRPGDLKVQSTPVPYLGGLGVAAAVVVGLVGGHRALWLPLGMALAIGVLDDARGMGPATRLSAEVLTGLVAAAVLPVRLPGVVGTAAVTIAVVLLINGVNLIDGLDALAGGVALASALGFALVLNGDGRSLALALAGGLAGFLVFNWPPARVYMGDGGAYLVGTALALLLCFAWQRRNPLALSLGSLPLVAVPLAEIGCAVLRRARSGARLFAGDRGHGYDRLVSRRWSRNRAVSLYVVGQAVLSAAAVGAVHLPTPAAAAVTGGCALLLFSASAALGFLAPSSAEAAP